MGRMIVAVIAAMLAGGVPASGQDDALAEPIIVQPIVHGAAGPFPRVTVTLRRDEPRWGSHFSGMLETGDGRRFRLEGPDLPAQFFLTDVKAVVFTPLARTGGNGVVVLYTSAQIGPMHGVQSYVLAYRVTATGAVRQRALEEKLEGVRNAAALRTRLRALSR